jgi:hypothetical protein
MKEKEMIVHSTPIKLDRVLDLTDGRNLNLLATAEQDLDVVFDESLPSKSYPYEVPHIIGETAARYGFDAILVPPSVKSAGPHVKNIVILNGRTP